MVAQQIRARGVRDPRVLEVMLEMPRHEFVPPESRDRAYADEPLPIGGGQTISQPFMVAVMTALLHLKTTDRALEIGTGCGYQAAVLARLCREVHTVECVPFLATGAAERLRRLGYSNASVHSGDGSLGLAEFSPYDAILVAAAAPQIPPPLAEQLAEGGRLVIPIGEPDHQTLCLATKERGVLRLAWSGGCRFVPLHGEFGWRNIPPR